MSYNCLLSISKIPSFVLFLVIDKEKLQMVWTLSISRSLSCFSHNLSNFHDLLLLLLFFSFSALNDPESPLLGSFLHFNRQTVFPISHALVGNCLNKHKGIWILFLFLLDNYYKMCFVQDPSPASLLVMDVV